MTKYAIQVNGKGTILSVQVENPDPVRFTSKSLIGKNFSRLIGWDCNKELQMILRSISRTQQSASFSTFIASKGSKERPVLDWVIQPKGRTLCLSNKYFLYGTEQE
jgi:hypothetical protein